MTYKIVVNRYPQDHEEQTLGELVIKNISNDVFTCKTLELGWKDNKKGESCIPKGVYLAIKRNKTNAIPYEHIILLNVPKRDGICIHRGNYYTQIKGCLLVGKLHVDLNKDGLKDVTHSTETLNKIMNILPDKFEVEIL